MTMFLLGNAQAGPLGASALFCVKNVAFAERLVDPCGRPLRTAEGNLKKLAPLQHGMLLLAQQL